MDIGFFVKGVVIGLSIAAPVGPIGVLCIQRTLSGGALYGLVSGLGAATADALYGLMAAFGVTFITNLLVAQQFWFRLIGGIFLCYLGIRAVLKKPSQQAVAESSFRHAGAYGSTLLLTLTNPITILSFVAIFAGLGIGSDSQDYGAAALFVMGVFLGSAGWWCFLSGMISLFRGQLNHHKLSWINRISGSVIITFGVLALRSVLHQIF